jgi:hypothetical protein
VKSRLACLRYSLFFFSFSFSFSLSFSLSFPLSFPLLSSGRRSNFALKSAVCISNDAAFVSTFLMCTHYADIHMECVKSVHLVNIDRRDIDVSFERKKGKEPSVGWGCPRGKLMRYEVLKPRYPSLRAYENPVRLRGCWRFFLAADVASKLHSLDKL